MFLWVITLHNSAPSQMYLLFHVLKSLTDFCTTTSELQLAGRYRFYRASSETSQNLNNRTSLCMSAEEECSRSVGMQPGNYSHIRQLSRVFSSKPVISQLPALIGAALTASVFVWKMVVHISVNLWPLEPQPVACTWKKYIQKNCLEICWWFVGAAGWEGLHVNSCCTLSGGLPFWPLLLKFRQSMAGDVKRYTCLNSAEGVINRQLILWITYSI